MNKQPLIITVLILIAAITACTEVDLCEEAEHPHRAHVIFKYQWNDDDTRLPDSMVIAAVRIMNLWKCGIICNHRTDSGRYIVNAPLTIPTWADPETYYPTPPPPPPSGYIQVEAGNPEPPATETAAPKPDAIYQHFALREGTFKFLTLNKDAQEVIIDPIYQYLAAGNEDMQTTDITVSYRTYALGDPALRTISHEPWSDVHNPGFPYIQPGAAPVYFDTVLFHNIYKGGQENRIDFRPKRVTQTIDLYVGIGKKNSAVKCRIDSVLCELSGIPIKMAVVNGYLDISRTAKTLFWTDFVDTDHQPIPGDTYTSDTCVVHANIDATSIVSPHSTSEVTGPGILVLCIYTTALDSEGNTKTKRYMARINMYHSLQKAQLMHITDDQQHIYRTAEHGVVNVKTTIKIEAADIVTNSDENGGFDPWDNGGVIDGTDEDPIAI
ncbi:MAG: hypothetical protein IJ081_06585 [Prevotella sp.]|nr:hypothetical protein [Prevotella sp.]